MPDASPDVSEIAGHFGELLQGRLGAGPLALVTLLILEVVDGITAFRWWKLGKEVVVVLRLTCLRHHNLSVVW